MAKTKATKKACSDLSTELDDDFISRAMRSNPVELLENEALKFDFLFNQNPNPVFRAYHDESLALEDKVNFYKIVSGQASKQFYECVTAFCLRKDISVHCALTYASSYLKNKSYIKSIAKRNPELSTWKGIYSVFLDLYKEYFASKGYYYDFGHTHINIWRVLEFYTRLDPTPGQIRQALEDIMCLVSKHSKTSTHLNDADKLLFISYSSTKRLFKFILDKDYVTDIIYTLYQTRCHLSTNVRNTEYNTQFCQYMTSRGYSYTESVEKCFVMGIDILDRMFIESPQTFERDPYYAERVLMLKMFNYVKRTNPSLFEEKLGDSFSKLDQMHPWSSDQSLVRRYREKLLRQDGLWGTII